VLSRPTLSRGGETTVARAAAVTLDTPQSTRSSVTPGSVPRRSYTLCVYVLVSVSVLALL
jgi:hypothetical protein